LKRNRDGIATFETLAGDRSRVVGSLEFATVARLLPPGTAAIEGGHAAVIDLAGVTDSDSSGLALLIEWLSVAKASGHPLRYDNMPAQLHQLAGLSEVEGLFTSASA
jgi:phospholipid transport system transporter-binding protein